MNNVFSVTQKSELLYESLNREGSHRKKSITLPGETPQNSRWEANYFDPTTSNSATEIVPKLSCGSSHLFPAEKILQLPSIIILILVVNDIPKIDYLGGKLYLD